jgi:hypothetical protein
MDEIKAEIEKLKQVREENAEKIIQDLKSDIELLKEAREAEYANILGGIKDMKSESKMNKYKLTSAIKYNSHVHSTNMNEIKQEIQNINSQPSSCSVSTNIVEFVPISTSAIKSNYNDVHLKILIVDKLDEKLIGK